VRSNEGDNAGELESLGRITLGLFGTHAPLAVQNFRGLVSCNTGQSFQVPRRKAVEHPDGTTTTVVQEETVAACFKDTVFHRIIPYFLIQGGDFTHGDGTGGATVLPASLLDETQQSKNPLYRRFPLEGWTTESLHRPAVVMSVPDPDATKVSVRFNRKHVLAMAHPVGKPQNGSQFFLTTVKTQWLDGQYTIFGTVLHGSATMDLIENEGTYGGRPRRTVVITDCGEVPLEDEDKEIHY
jgi:peptidylprolyl isomerase